MFSVSPASTQKGNGGSGGGVAAVASGAGAKMGGGSPVPTVTSLGVQELERNEGGAAFVDEVANIVWVRKMYALLLEDPVVPCCLKFLEFECEIVMIARLTGF